MQLSFLYLLSLCIDYDEMKMKSHLVDYIEDGHNQDSEQ